SGGVPPRPSDQRVIEHMTTRSCGPRLWPHDAACGRLTRARRPARVGAWSADPRPSRGAWPAGGRAWLLGGRVELARWDESLLVRRCQEGSEAAYAELVRR